MPRGCRSCRARVYSSVLCGPMSSSAPRNLRSTPCVTQPRSRLSSPLPRWASRPAEAAQRDPAPGATPARRHQRGPRQEARRRHRLRRRWPRRPVVQRVRRRRPRQGQGRARRRVQGGDAGQRRERGRDRGASPAVRRRGRDPRHRCRLRLRQGHRCGRQGEPRCQVRDHRRRVGRLRWRQRRAADLRRGAGLLPRRRRRRPQVEDQPGRLRRWRRDRPHQEVRGRLHRGRQGRQPGHHGQEPVPLAAAGLLGLQRPGQGQDGRRGPLPGRRRRRLPRCRWLGLGCLHRCQGRGRARDRCRLRPGPDGHAGGA